MIPVPSGLLTSILPSIAFWTKNLLPSGNPFLHYSFLPSFSSLFPSSKPFPAMIGTHTPPRYPAPISRNHTGTFMAQVARESSSPSAVTMSGTSTSRSRSQLTTRNVTASRTPSRREAGRHLEEAKKQATPALTTIRVRK